MKKSPLQFSLAALLLTVAVVAGDLALMLQAPPRVAEVILFAVMVAILAFLAVAFIYGRNTWRPFCIGAGIVLLIPFIFSTMNLGMLLAPLRNSEQVFSIIGIADPSEARMFLGGFLLASIALGYLCVGFRWLIETREPPDA